MRRLHAHRPEAYTVSELCGLFGKSKQADSYGKMILGSSVGMTLEVRYPMEALSEAMELLASHEVDLSKTIHHSDRGVQYTCADYVTELHKNKVMISMTESGNPKDNAEAERINNTLKRAIDAMMANAVEGVDKAKATG